MIIVFGAAAATSGGSSPETAKEEAPPLDAASGCSSVQRFRFVIAAHNQRRWTSEERVSPEPKMNPSSGARSGKTFLFTSESVGEGHSGTVAGFCLFGSDPEAEKR